MHGVLVCQLSAHAKPAYVSREAFARVLYQVGSRRLPWLVDGRELCLPEDVMT